MNKYINIIIFSVFALLTNEYGMGLTLFIPVLIYFGLNDFRSLILIFISAVAVNFFREGTLLVPLIFHFAVSVIYSLMFKKRNNNARNLFFTLIFNALSYVLIFGFKDVFMLALYAVISTVLLALLYANQGQVLENPNKFEGFGYNELLFALIATFGGAKVIILDVNLGLLVAIYFSIYFCSSKKYYRSIIFSMITTYALHYLLDVKNSFIIIIVGTIYFFPRIISTVVLYTLSLFLLITKTVPESENLIQAIMIIGLFFEIVRFTVIIDDAPDILSHNIYDNVVSNIRKETVSFASFLDLIDKEISYDKSYREKMKEGVRELYKMHCDECSIKRECIGKNKGKLYYYYKAMIENGESNNDFCINYNDFRISSSIVRQKYNFINGTRKNEILSLITNGFSTILRQLSIESTVREELNYDDLYAIKKAMNDYGYTVTLYDVKRANKENFLIELGVVGEDYNDIKNNVLKICNHFIKEGASLIYKKTSNQKHYFNVVPKIKYDVTYGYGSLAPVGNSICGDNYLVKQLENSRIVAAISDGMGKGLAANMQSTSTLRMVDQITNMDILPETSLQILNTLLYIQDYQEIYSTLDFVEINRKNGETLLYKAGGTTTYLFHQNGDFEKLLNENLPFGIEEMIDIKRMQLNNNDLIVIASDGVFENVADSSNLEKYILGIRHLEPQKIIYELLNHIRYSEVINKDDISIIALKVKAF